MTPEELRKLRKAVVKKIRFDKTPQEIVQWLVEDYEISEIAAKDWYKKCKKDVQDSYNRYAKETAKINIQRIENIIEETYEKGNYKVCLAAIAELNKMGHLYQEKIEISTAEPLKVIFG